MSIEILPVGVTCNLRCDYCYEQSEREKQSVHTYNRDAVIEGLKYSRGYWQIFGGEPLLLRIEQLEELLKIGYEKWGYTGIQTNGTLITPAHIDVFRKYNTQVGISLDGPDDLNDSRWAGTVEATRKATAKTHRAIDMVIALSKEPGAWPAHGPTLIVTLHSGNVSKKVFPKFEKWLRHLNTIGVRFINFHFLEVDYKANKWAISDEQLTHVMKKLRILSEEFKTLQFLNFGELEKTLMGDTSQAMCVWQACDPWSTAAVQGLNNEGEPSNCSRGSKDGIGWLPAEGSGSVSRWGIGTEFYTNRFHERQLSLYVTPEEHGGCNGCRFWLMCTGYCPGTGSEVADIRDSGEKSDWRTKSSHCNSLKTQFVEVESKLISFGQVPISQRPDRIEIEKLQYNLWSEGKDCNLEQALRILEHKSNPSNDIDVTQTNISHGDHTDIAPHGDHTDIAPHGDHTEIPNPSEL